MNKISNRVFVCIALFLLIQFSYVSMASAGFIDSGQGLGNSKSNDVALEDLDGDGDVDAFVANNIKSKP